jgi:hypothetical protein
MKFRVFSIKENKYLLPFDFAVNGDGEIFSLRSGIEEDGYFTGYNDEFDLIIEEAIEDTDKNGTEIYVGDLVKAKSKRTQFYLTCRVRRLQGHLGFTLDSMAIPEHNLTDKEII